MKQILTLIFILTTTLVTAQNNPDIINGISLTRLQRYEDWINKEIKEKRIPGATTLIFRDDKIVYQSTLGYQDIQNGKELQPDDIFSIASMTKPIVSVALMILYEEGHFLLSDPVSKFIPAFGTLRVSKDREEGIDGETLPLHTPVTIRHLLTHTAGFASQGPSLLEQQITKHMNGETYSDIQERVAKMLEFPLIAQPGESFIYGPCTDVLCVLIEHFSGMPVRDFLKTRIFKPLQMKDTDYNIPESDRRRRVLLHERIEDNLVVSSDQASTHENTLHRGVTGLFSTQGDYLNFCEMLMHEGSWNRKRILSPKTVQLMLANHTQALYKMLPGHYFGLGFAVTDNVGTSQVSGSQGLFLWAGLYNTHFFIDPSEKLIVIFMTQSLPFNLNYPYHLRQLVYQALVESYQN